MNLNQLFLKNFRVVMALFLITVAVLVFTGIRKRKKKLAEIEEINVAIDNAIGAEGVDITTLIKDVMPANGFNALPFATTIYHAKGYFNDDEEAVYDVFRNKTLRKIAAIDKAMQQHYGFNLDTYLRSPGIVPGTVFLNESEYSIAINIIKALPHG